MRSDAVLPASRTVVPTLCLGLVSAVGAAVLGGSDAVAGVVIGLALVVLFFLSGRVPLRLGRGVPPSAAFLLLGLNYMLRIGLLLLALRALRDADWLDRRVLGGAVIVGALLWNAVQVRGHLTSRRAAVEPVGSELTRELSGR